MRAGLAENEGRRLAALRGLQILDSAPDAAFDELVQMAAEVCDVPAAYIALIDRERQWIKSSYGVALGQTPRDAALCAHAILNSEPLVVGDASKDPRFADNPLVTGGPRIRFYAGAPLLMADSLAVGTLCVVDFMPRTISYAQLRWLTALSRQVVWLMESRRDASALATARDAAESSTRAKSVFLANMSHEIRTPMTAIIGYADLMLDPKQNEAQRQQCLQVIRRNGRHLLDLISDILDLSKLDAGRMTVRKTDCDLASLLAEVKSVMGSRAAAKNLTLQLALSGAAPAPRHICTDGLRLRQILVNLVGNAIKFTQRGGVRLTVGHALGQHGRGILEIQVQDTGIGIAPPQMKTLFSPFAPGDCSMTRRHGGTGLGLTISRRLARMLGGDLTVNSAPGVGSTFKLRIDSGSGDETREVCDLAAVESCQATANPQTQVPRLAARILLAEDGRDNQRLIQTILAQAGAEVEVAENGRDAVELALDGDFDAVVMDMQMPLLDGYGATSELRRRGFARPIIALTAHAMSDDREKCLHAGCDDYLAKPVERMQLLQTLAAHIAGEKPGHPASSAPAPPRPSPAAPRPSPPGPQRAGGPLVSEFASDPAMTTVIGQFVSQLSPQVAEMQRCLDEADVARLRVLVHQLKGSGGGYGFAELTHLAAVAEESIKSDLDLQQVKRDIEALLGTIRRIDGYHDQKAASGLA